MDGRYDAIVLAGGAARRLGGRAKPQLVVDGRTLLDRALDAVAGAGRIVVVGPRQPTSRPVEWAIEEPAGGGPVAAIAAGLPLTAAELVVVLAADLPWIAPAVPALLAAAPSAGVALLVDADGRTNQLAAAWRRATLDTALRTLPQVDGAAVRELIAAAARPVLIPDPDRWGRDCDTWEDLADARARGGDH